MLENIITVGMAYMLGVVLKVLPHLSPLRDQHLYNTDPLYLPEEKAFVTETQVIRETLW